MPQRRQRGFEEELGICLGVCGKFPNVLFLADILTLRAENKKGKQSDRLWEFSCNSY